MTRETKRIAVDVAPSEQQISEPEPSTDAEQLTELAGTMDATTVANDVKPKAKQVSQRKRPTSDGEMKIPEPMPEVTPEKPVDITRVAPSRSPRESIASARDIVAESKPKIHEKVNCPDCGKQMTGKT